MTEIQDRRGAARIAILGRPSARVRGTVEVWLVDISASGARITLDELMQHGSSCTLKLPPALGSLTLSARIVWSGIFGGEQTLEGERHIIYQSGLTFVDLTTDEQAALGAIVQRLARRSDPGQRQD
jgi:PilZ domain